MDITERRKEMSTEERMELEVGSRFVEDCVISGIIGWGDKAKPTLEWWKRGDQLKPTIRFTLVRNDPRYRVTQDAKTGKSIYPIQKYKVYYPIEENQIGVIDNMYRGRSITLKGTFAAESFVVKNDPKSTINHLPGKRVSTTEIDGVKVDSIPMECFHATSIKFNDKQLERQLDDFIALLDHHGKGVKNLKKNGKSYTSGSISISVEDFIFAIKKFKEESIVKKAKPGNETKQSEEITEETVGF